MESVLSYTNNRSKVISNHRRNKSWTGMNSNIKIIFRRNQQ